MTKLKEHLLLLKGQLHGNQTAKHQAEKIFKLQQALVSTPVSRPDEAVVTVISTSFGPSRQILV
jgi:hypothetical protein